MRNKTSALLKISLLFVAVVGCGWDHPPVHPDMVVDSPVEETSAIAVLGDLYDIHTAPQILWYGKKLNCPGGGWDEPGVGCLYGWYGPKDALMVIATLEPVAPMHGTALTHEFFHYFLYVTGGDADSDHKNLGWEFEYSGLHGGPVERGWAALTSAGM